MGQVQRLPAGMLDAIVLHIRSGRKIDFALQMRLIRCGLGVQDARGHLVLTDAARTHPQVAKRLATANLEPTEAQVDVMRQVRKGRNFEISIRGRVETIRCCEREGWITHDKLRGYELTSLGEEVLGRLQREQTARMIDFWIRHDGRARTG